MKGKELCVRQVLNDGWFGPCCLEHNPTVFNVDESKVINNMGLNSFTFFKEHTYHKLINTLPIFFYLFDLSKKNQYGFDVSITIKKNRKKLHKQKSCTTFSFLEISFIFV